MSIFLLDKVSTTSADLPLIVPVLSVAILNLNFCRGFSLDDGLASPHLALPMTTPVAPLPLVPCSLSTLLLTTIVMEQGFTAGCPS